MLALALTLALADTPESAVQSFLAAWNRGDVPAMVKLVEGANPNADRKQLSDYLASGDMPKVAVKIVKREGDRVYLRFLQTSPYASLPTQVVQVVKRFEGWKVVPSLKTGDGTFLGSLASLVMAPEGGREFVRMMRSNMQIETARGNLQMIALATIGHAMDHKDVFRLTAKGAKKSIVAELESDRCFKDPATGRIDVYNFNSRLTGVSRKKIKRPAQTVLWYVGEGEKILYPYDGKTLVAMVSGDVEILTPEETEGLLWKP